MKKFFTAAFIIAAAACTCSAQSVVKMNINQNPLFEVSTNNVNVAGADAGTTLGGDLVIKGGSGTYSYRWYSATNANLGNAETLTVYAPGVYSLDITDSCDCLQTVVFNVTMAGIADIAIDTPAITPNPTAGPVEIKGFDAVQIVIVNMAGAMEAIVDFGGAVINNADLSFLARGNYIVTLTDNTGKYVVTKLIKK